MTHIAKTPGVLPILNTSTVLIATNPVLLLGQIAQETDKNRSKVGDGETTYTNLTYVEFSYEIIEAAGTDTYTGNLAIPFLLDYFPLMRIRVRFANSNTGASTININGFGAKTIFRGDAHPLVAGDILGGCIYELSYDGTNMQLMTPTAHAVNSIYITTANDVVANTTTETDIINAATFVGSKTLSTDFFMVGKSFKIDVRGFHSTTGSPTIQFRLRVGGIAGTIVADSGAQTIGPGTANGGWCVEASLTTRTIGVAGTVIGQGSIFMFKSNSNRDTFDLVATGTTVIDTTASQELVLSVEWGTAAAGNTITSTNCDIQELN